MNCQLEIENSDYSNYGYEELAPRCSKLFKKWSKDQQSISMRHRIGKFERKWLLLRNL